jgi:hypothetical protein
MTRSGLGSPDPPETSSCEPERVSRRLSLGEPNLYSPEFSGHTSFGVPAARVVRALVSLDTAPGVRGAGERGR